MTIEEYILKRCKETGTLEACCTSCLEDMLMGYGDDIAQCCCRHSNFVKEAQNLGLKYKWESQ